jgi:ribose transport system substrate-binding protein
MELSRWGAVVGFCLSLAALVPPATACGGGSVARETAGGTADLAAVEAQISKYEAIPAFVPPGPAFDAVRRVRGKRIFEIPITSEVPFITAVEEGMRQAAAAVGAELVVYPNQGEPSQWVQGIRAAIAQKADAITLFAQNPAVLGPQIKQAKEAGIPVIVVRTTGEGEPCQTNPSGKIYGTTCVPGPFEQAGRLEADWVILDSRGTANVLVITSNDARSTVPLVQGMKDEFATRCPSCQVRYVDVPIPDWAARVRTEVQSALVRDPSIEYVIPIYDSMSQYVVPAIRASKREDQVRIATFNGTPFVLKLLQDDDVVRMDVGENLSWVGWATMDQAFRLIAGEKPVRTERTPLRVFTDANVGETGRPPALDKGYGEAYVAGYKRLWGVSD